jgi:hypothetical protein
MAGTIAMDVVTGVGIATTTASSGVKSAATMTARNGEAIAATTDAAAGTRVGIATAALTPRATIAGAKG